MNPRRTLVILGVGLLVIASAAVFRSRAKALSIPPASAEPAKRGDSAPPPESQNGPGAPASIRGVVLDGKTEKPIPGVQLLFHHPRPAQRSERIEERLFPSYSKNGRNISLGHFYVHPDTAWVYDRPQPGVPAAAQANSNEAGEFEAALPFSRFIIECRHPDYMTSYFPVLWDSSRRIVLHLHAGVLVRGRVVRVDGRPIHEKLELALFGKWNPKSGTPGMWVTMTDEMGFFQCEVAAAAIYPKIQIPGWRVVSPDEPVEVVQGMTLEVTARRVPVLRVMEAETRAPIEKFSVMLGPPGSPGGWRRGEFDAPGGVLPLLYDTIPDSSYRGPFKIQVWTEGKVPFEAEVSDLLTSEDIVAALARGEAPAVTGVVLRGGSPLEVVDVSLNSGFVLSGSWKPEKLAKVASSRTDSQGAFTLKAPAGPYVLLVTAGSLVHAVVVQAPQSSVIVDLADLAEIQVRTKDGEGRVLTGIIVLLQSAQSDRRWYETSDSSGAARFKSIPPGDSWIAHGKVHYPGVNEYTNNLGSWMKIHAPPGQTTTVDLAVEVEGSRKPLASRLSIRGLSGLDGWKVLDASVFSREEAPLAVSADGRFALPSREAGLLIVSPGGARWRLIPPKNADEWEADLDPEGPGYEGLVRDLATGAPISDAAVSASGQRPGVWMVSSKTDAEGRFSLRGLGPGPHRISISKGEKYGIGLEPSMPPAEDPPQWKLSIPAKLDFLSFEGLSNRRISGRVVDSLKTGIVSNSRIGFSAVLKIPEGNLIATLQSSSANLDSDGKFTVTVPIAGRYRATIGTGHGRPDFRSYQREWEPAAAGDLTVDFRVP